MKLPLHKSGETYGSLTLTGKSYSEFIVDRKRRYLECLCICGNVVYNEASNFRSGRVKSCGCKNDGSTTHGLSSDPVYTAWVSMKGRCYNENDISYPNYGGRGIIVCAQWLNNPEVFIAWSLANGWKEGLSLDRFPNNDGVYEPTNCRWATREQQDRNKRNTCLLTAFGETKCLTDWSNDERCVVSYTALFQRIHKFKMSSEEAITKPKKV